MKYIYRNNTKRTILYRNYFWLPDDEISTAFPVPDELGLTCIQEGEPPDAVLFHDDVTIAPGEQAVVTLNAPAFSNKVDISIQCMTLNSGVACRFGSLNNNPIPIDTRVFSQVLEWELCSRIFLENSTENEAVISITAIETGD